MRTKVTRMSIGLRRALPEVEHCDDVRDQRSEQREGERHVEVEPELEQGAVAEVVPYALGQAALPRHFGEKLLVQPRLFSGQRAAELFQRVARGKGRARRRIEHTNQRA